MGLIKEPLNVDFVIQSTPWTEEEVNELRAIMKKAKTKGKAKRTKDTIKQSFGAFQSAQSAEEIVSEIRTSRTFARKIEKI